MFPALHVTLYPASSTGMPLKSGSEATGTASGLSVVSIVASDSMNALRALVALSSAAIAAARFLLAKARSRSLETVTPSFSDTRKREVLALLLGVMVHEFTGIYPQNGPFCLVGASHVLAPFVVGSLGIGQEPGLGRLVDETVVSWPNNPSVTGVLGYWLPVNVLEQFACRPVVGTGRIVLVTSVEVSSQCSSP